jgi:flagellar biosynthesis protein FlhF
MEALHLPLTRTPDPDSLAAESVAATGSCLIDTVGVNPFQADDISWLQDLADAANAESLLVLPAGLDVNEAADITAHFRETMGIKRIIHSGLDRARRFGSVLAAHAVPGVAFSDVSVSPRIGDALRPLNPVALARLLLSADPKPHSSLREADS